MSRKPWYLQSSGTFNMTQNHPFLPWKKKIQSVHCPPKGRFLLNSNRRVSCEVRTRAKGVSGGRWGWKPGECSEDSCWEKGKRGKEEIPKGTEGEGGWTERKVRNKKREGRKKKRESLEGPDQSPHQTNSYLKIKQTEQGKSSYPEPHPRRTWRGKMTRDHDPRSQIFPNKR